MSTYVSRYYEVRLPVIDENLSNEKELQDITDKHIAECDKIYAAKEKEIMSI